MCKRFTKEQAIQMTDVVMNVCLQELPGSEVCLVDRTVIVSMNNKVVAALCCDGTSRIVSALNRVFNGAIV